MSISCHIYDMKCVHHLAMKMTYLKIIGHVLSAIWQVTFYFPWVDNSSKDRRIKNWCQKLLKILEINLQLSGFDSLPSGGILFASNHISWLDIMVINAAMPVRFVAKSEVKQWPIFGYLADQLNTLYIQRNNRGDVSKMVGQLINALNKGESICIFPEGTSSDGLTVLPFRSNLFEAVINSNSNCMPLAITYKDSMTRQQSIAPAYFGEINLIKSIKNIVNSSPIDVFISVIDVTNTNRTRKELCDEVWKKVNQMHQSNANN